MVKFLKHGGKKTKFIVVAVIMIIVILVSFFCVNAKRKAAMAKNVGVQMTRTEAVKKQSLIKSVGATGTVVSVDSKDLSISLTNIDVQSVDVEVGDTVEAGQMLMAFDTSDIEEDLADAKTQLSEAKEKNALSESDAARNVSDSELTKDFQVSSAQTKVDNAYSQYQQAAGNCASAKTTLDSLKAAESQANDTYTALGTSLSAASEKLNAAQSTYQTAQSNAAASPDDAALAAALKEAQAAYESAQNEYNTINAQYGEAQNAYQTAVANRTAQESAVQQAETQVASTYSDYNEQLKNYDYTVAQQDSSVAKAKSSQSATELSSDVSEQENKVEEYQSQLEEGILYAPIAGTVTAVNYEAGDTYDGGTIITIQDCSSYEIEAEIGEYDISSIEKGQEVLIKTDATGDDELKGSVTFISPTSTASEQSSNASAGGSTTSSGSTDVSYKIRISMEQPDERLRLDMSASLSIVIEEHKDVLTVPYNAVWTDNDGNSFVTVVDGENSTDIAVEVVMESNYYTEISASGIKEGDMVEIVNDSDESDGNFGAAPGGMPGGDGGQGPGAGGGPGQGGGF